jgi:hypothetical protein
LLKLLLINKKEVSFTSPYVGQHVEANVEVSEVLRAGQNLSGIEGKNVC